MSDDNEKILQEARDSAVAAKDKAETARDDAVAAKGAAETARDSADMAKGDAVTARDDAVAAKDEIGAARDGAVAAKDEAGAARDGAVAAKDEADTARDGAVAAKGEADTARDGAVAAKGEADTARDGAVAAKGKAEAAQDGATTAKGEADTARDGAVAAKDEAGAARDGATTAKGEVDEIVTNISAIDTRNRALQVEIEELLPRAASAAIAHAFRAAKLRYGNEPKSEVPLKESDKVPKTWTDAWLYVVFVVTVIALFVTLLPFAFPALLGESGSSVASASGWLGVISRIAVVAPLTWFAIHINKTINQRRRLYEEYNYKQRLAQFYIGFRKYAENDEYLRALLVKLLEVVATPPSITKQGDLDHPMSELIGALTEKANKLLKGKNPKDKSGSKPEDKPGS